MKQIANRFPSLKLVQNFIGNMWRKYRNRYDRRNIRKYIWYFRRLRKFAKSDY
jgi:hypothetical protein